MDEALKTAAPHITEALSALQRGQDVQQVLGAISVLAILGLAGFIVMMRRDHAATIDLLKASFEAHRKDVVETTGAALEASRQRFSIVESSIGSIEKRLDDIKDRLRDFGLQVIAVYREAMGLARKDEHNGDPKP